MVMAVVLACTMSMQAPVLLDRTLAIVGGRTITLSDARTAVALGLIGGRDVTAATVERLVERELMLREAERYAPEEPAVAAVAERLVGPRDWRPSCARAGSPTPGCAPGCVTTCGSSRTCASGSRPTIVGPT